MAKNTPILSPIHDISGVKGRGKFNIHVGQIWPTRNFGNLEVVGLPEKGIKSVTVKFLLTSNVLTIQPASLVRGTVKDKLFGVGYNSKGVYGTTGKYHKCYDYWKTMIMRSYSQDYTLLHPTYRDVTVAEGWLDYQNFAKWYFQQTYLGDSYNLDKDLLKVGNLEYSPENCCLLPQEVNKALTVREGVKGYVYHKRDQVHETTYRSVYLGRSTDYTLTQLQQRYVNARNKYVRGLGKKYSTLLPNFIIKALEEYTCCVGEDGLIRRIK
ncbi:hypothetical protein NVP1187O_059 [Vibrio phage 1.187.O._10N.286.49.F1]|nr:hypothetical protein NVP1187O_059 [Vibrio phage 1.187.O._10N.286.49.F1]